MFPKRCLLLLIAMTAAAAASGAQRGPQVLTAGNIRVDLEPRTGRYNVVRTDIGWTLAGSLDGPAEHAAMTQGRDAVGPYVQIGFERPGQMAFYGAIRLYAAAPVVWFRAHYLETLSGNGIEFPKLSAPTRDLHTFSYADSTFAPPTLNLAQTATPWLLFDDQARSMVISPASNFMVSSMLGGLDSELCVGLNAKLRSVPSGFNQDSVLVFADGINAAWDRWGGTMRALFRKSVPANGADVLLRDFGYWTDNGADYYYNYDPSLGYADTLLKLANSYRRNDLPMGYMQLDSWWYEKSTNGPDGKPGGAKKNSKLPIGAWNRYGGLMDYQADPDLFPDGLAAFRTKLGLPLAVHNRWIDRNSPYHDQYRISGVAATDPRWWRDVVAYLKESGVVCYEQDWLDQIYLNSPEMASTVGVGDAFTDGMANACREAGLNMQYCMGTPRFFLQGLKYSNLTTIRTSGDRFEPGKWAHFLYVSRLAHDVGIWPWCDVFKSAEGGNMLLSVLSAGPVGTGDALGKEDPKDIRMAARPDGVIVKPDVPLMPCDKTYIDEANHRKAPFLASTYTDYGSCRVTYVVAFPRRRGDLNVMFRPVDVGVRSKCSVYDMKSVGEPITFHEPGDTLSYTISGEGYGYWAIYTPSRDTFLLGDLEKFVPLGKAVIPEMEDTKAGQRVTVNFAKGQDRVLLNAFSADFPTVRAISGTAVVMPVTTPGRANLFVLQVSPKPGQRQAVFLLGPLKRAHANPKPNLSGFAANSGKVQHEVH